LSNAASILALRPLNLGFSQRVRKFTFVFILIWASQEWSQFFRRYDVLSDPYGVNDNIASYDASCVTPNGKPVNYELDVLPFVLKAISSSEGLHIQIIAFSPYSCDSGLHSLKTFLLVRASCVAASNGMDPVLSHWMATSSYIGLGLQGSATQTMLLSGIQITAE
jgi:hypothetical protein